MARKIRSIYKGDQQISLINIQNKEPLKVVAVNSTGQESIVYSREELCSITINYSDKTIVLQAFKNDTLESCLTELDTTEYVNDINTAVANSYFKQWSVSNNGTITTTTPSSTSAIISSLKNIIVNGDMIITAVYNGIELYLNFYKDDHETLFQTFKFTYGSSISATIESATADFSDSDIYPNDHGTLYDYTFNGWTQTKGTEIKDTNLPTTITSDIKLYPVYNSEKIKYTMSIYKKDTNGNWEAFDTVEIYYDESYKTAIANTTNHTSNTDKLNSLTDVTIDGTLYTYETTKLFLSSTGTTYITQDTLLSNIPSAYITSHIVQVYINYSTTVLTYTVKLIDELTSKSLYYANNIVYGCQLSTIVSLNTYITSVTNETYHSSGETETEKYVYYYWLEYENTGNEYKASDTVTSNTTLIIRYGRRQRSYTIEYQLWTNQNSIINKVSLEKVNASYGDIATVSLKNTKYISMAETTYDLEKHTQTVTESESCFTGQSTGVTLTANDTWTVTQDEVFVINGTIETTTLPNPTYYLFTSEDDTHNFAVSPSPAKTESLNVSCLETIATGQMWNNGLGGCGKNQLCNDSYYYDIFVDTWKIKVIYYDDTSKTFYCEMNYAGGVSNHDITLTNLKGIKYIYFYVNSTTPKPIYVNVRWYTKYGGTTSYISSNTNVKKGTLVKDLTYPSYPSLTGYTFSYWTPAKTSTDAITTSPYYIYAVYTANSSSGGNTPLPTTPGVYIKTSNNIWQQICSITWNSNTKYMTMTASDFSTTTTSKNSYNRAYGTVEIAMRVPEAIEDNYGLNNEDITYPLLALSSSPSVINSIEQRKSSTEDMTAGYYNTDVTNLTVKYDAGNGDSDAVSNVTTTIKYWTNSTNPSYNTTYKTRLYFALIEYTKNSLDGATIFGNTDQINDYGESFYVDLTITYKSSSSGGSSGTGD